MPNRNLDKWMIHVDIDGPWQVLGADGSLGPKLPLASKDSQLSEIVWNPARDQIALVDGGSRLCLWLLGAPSVRVIKQLIEPPQSLGWSPDGQALGLLGQSSVLFVRPDGSRVFSLQLGNLVPLRESTAIVQCDPVRGSRRSNCTCPSRSSRHRAA